MYALVIGNEDLNLKVVNLLGLKIINCKINTFADGECGIEIQDDIRGKEVALFVSVCGSVNDSVMKMMFALDALKRCCVSKINLIVPYMFYARQDRMRVNGACVSMKVIANMIGMYNVSKVATLDLHSMQTTGFFNCPLYNISTDEFFTANIIKQFGAEASKLVVVSPDFGSVKRARKIATGIECEVAILEKNRTAANVSNVVDFYGANIKNRACIIVDDIVDTAGTLCNTAQMLMDLGAKNVYSYATHGLFSGPAVERIEKSKLSAVYTTNTLDFFQSSFLGEDFVNLSKMRTRTLLDVNEYRNQESLEKVDVKMGFERSLLNIKESGLISTLCIANYFSEKLKTIL